MFNMSRSFFALKPNWQLNTPLLHSRFLKPRIPKRSFAAAMNAGGYSMEEQYNWAANASILAKWTKFLFQKRKLPKKRFFKNTRSVKCVKTAYT